MASERRIPSTKPDPKSRLTYARYGGSCQPITCSAHFEAKLLSDIYNEPMLIDMG